MGLLSGLAGLLRRRGNIIVWAALLTAIAVQVAIQAGPTPSAGRNYLQMCSWDCGWYTNIARDGYHSVIPPVSQDGAKANVAFFPGYPYLARALFLGLRLPEVSIPLLAVSQLSCVLFWIALLLLLERWKVRAEARVLAVLAIFAHPAAFFLVMGYSESLFLASMLLFFYWTDCRLASRRWLGAGAGFVMCATRIVGLPVAAYPVLRVLATEGRAAFRGRRLVEPLALGAVASLGALLFLAYCQWRWGDYRLYMETQRVGWGIVTDYGALWKWPEFRFMRAYDQFATVASGVGLAAAVAAEATASFSARGRAAAGTRGAEAPAGAASPFSRRTPLLACACLVFYVTLCGLKSVWFRSMIRYTLPWWIIGVLCLAEWSTHLPPWPPRAARAAAAAGAAGLLVFYYVFELHYLVDFMRGRWFA